MFACLFTFTLHRLLCQGKSQYSTVLSSSQRGGSSPLSPLLDTRLGWSLGVHVHVCHVRWDCTCAMLSWLVCRNGLHKHDFWEIIKSKTRHSYEVHTYLRHKGFARWFQRIESLFSGNWQNGPSFRDKCPCQFSHGRERRYQCMENGGGKHAHIDMFVAHCACRVQCWNKVKDLEGSLENMLNVFSVLLVTRTLSNGTINGSN